MLSGPGSGINDHYGPNGPKGSFLPNDPFDLQVSPDPKKGLSDGPGMTSDPFLTNGGQNVGYGF